MTVSTPTAPVPAFTATTQTQTSATSLTTATSAVSATLTTPLTTALTLECWVKPDGVTAKGTLFWFGCGTQQLTLSDATNLTISLGGTSIQTGIVLATNAWQHVSLAVTAEVAGKLGVLVVVGAAPAYQAPAALTAPSDWLDDGLTQTVGIGAPNISGSATTALTGAYAEFRVWMKALSTGLIITDAYYQIPAGDGTTTSAPLLVWPLDTIPAGATAVGASITTDSITYRTETLLITWSAVTGATYNLNVYASDNSWGATYQGLSTTSQNVGGFLVDHGVSATVQAVVAGEASGWSAAGSGQIFRLAIPATTATPGTSTTGSPTYTLSWLSVDQASRYLTSVTAGTTTTTQSQATTDLVLTAQLGSTTGCLVAIAAGYGTVMGPFTATTALATPDATATYTVATAGQVGTLSLSWTAVTGATSYYVYWTAVGTTTMPAAAQIVSGTVTSLGPYPAAATDGITYTAHVQALCAGGLSITDNASVTILPVIAPTNLSAVTAPASGTTAGTMTLSWTYSGPDGGAAGFEVTVTQGNGTFTKTVTTQLTSVTISDSSFTTDNWYTASVRFKSHGVTGPAGTMTVYILPVPKNFTASWNGAAGIISASYNAVTAGGVTANGAQIQYDVTVKGPLTGSSCTNVPADPSVNSILGPTAETTPSWPASSVAGISTTQSYSATVCTVVQGNSSSSVQSTCVKLSSTYVPLPVPGPEKDPKTNDPIGITTGSFAYDVTRLAQQAVLPIEFTIFYNSHFPTHAENASITDSPLGARWRHRFETALAFDTTQNTVTVILGSMEMIGYQNQAGTGELTSLGPFTGTRLFKTSSGYRLVPPDQSSWIFDSDGRATAFADPGGNQLALSYTSGKLTSVSLTGGTAYIQFSYASNGTLQGVTSSGGASISVEVTSNELKKLTVPDIGDWIYAYSSSNATYLQSATDPWNNVEFYNQYDGQGRVTRQYLADGYAASPQYYTSLSYGTGTYKGRTVATTTVTMPEGGVTTYSYDPDSLSIFQKSTALGTDANGDDIVEIVEIAYDGYYQIAQSTVYLGPTATYSDGKGNATTYQYNANRLMTQVTDPSGRSQIWTFDDANNLISQTDIWGNVTSWTYDGNHQCLSQTDAMGYVTRFDYWSAAEKGFVGLVHTVTDPLTNATEFDYVTGSGLLQTVTRPDASVVTYAYDSAGRRNSEAVAGEDGNRLSYTLTTYDNMGRKTSFAVQMGTQPADSAYQYEYTYDDPANHIQISYPGDLGGQRTLSVALNAERRPTVRTWQPFNGTTVTQTTGYDEDSRVGSLALGTRPATAYAYNALNDLISVTDPMGRVKTISRQQVITSGNGPYQTQQIVTLPTLDYKDPATGTVTSYLYTTTSLYDPGGVLVRKTLTLAPVATPSTPVWQQRTDWTYTSATVRPATGPSYQAVTETRTVTPVVPTGTAISTATTWNGIYRVVSATDARNYVTSISYSAAADPAGSSVIMLKETTTPPAGSAIDSYIDPSEQLVAWSAGTGAEARAGLYSYDALGRIVRVRVGDSLANLAAGTLTANGAAQSSFSYQYDGSAGVPRMRVDETQPVTDPTATPVVASSTYYDAFDNVVAETFAGGGTYTRTHTPWGPVAGFTQPSGGSIAFGFDNAGSLIQVTPTGSGVITHELDDAGNRLVTREAGNLVIQRSFDTWNRLISRTSDDDNIQQTLWPNGKLRTLTYPDGKSVSYALNGLGQWSTVTDWSGAVTTYSWTATGQLSQATFPNGVVTNYDYNAVGCPTSFSVTTPTGLLLAQLTYTPNQHNEPRAVSGIWPLPPTLPASATTLTYNNDTLATYNGTSLPSDGNASLIAIPASSGGADTVSVGYLEYGPLNTVGNVTYQYDADGLLTGRQDAGSTISYTVAPNLYQDPLLNMGSPPRSSVDAVTAPSGTGAAALLPVYGDGDVPPGIDQAMDMVLQILSGGTVQTRFIHGAGPLGQQPDGGSTIWYHSDPAGNIVAMTDANGNPAALFDYAPYGTIRATSVQTTPFYGFAGRFGVINDGSGVLAMRARFCDPQLMRFTARDLLAGDASIPTLRNRFVYGADNPLIYVDPLGLSIWSSISRAANSVADTILGAGRKLLKAAGTVGIIILGGLIAGAAAIRPIPGLPNPSPGPNGPKPNGPPEEPGEGSPLLGEESWSGSDTASEVSDGEIEMQPLLREGLQRRTFTVPRTPR